jgi:hypothetical protein
MVSAGHTGVVGGTTIWRELEEYIDRSDKSYSGSLLLIGKDEHKMHQGVIKNTNRCK